MIGVEVQAEQVRTLFRQTETVLVANCVNAAILASLLWASASHVAVGLWLAAVVLVAALRWALARRYRAAAAAGSRRWASRFVLGSATSGLLWGVGSLEFMTRASTPARLAIVFFIGGMCSAAAGTLAVYLPAFLAFALPALGALAAGVALVGEPLDRLLAAVIILYGLGLFAVAKVNSRAFTEAFALRFENHNLLATLSETQRSLEEANRTLERRVAERSEALRKQSEALRDAQRLEAVGRLAGGVAHDFNNLLTIVLANASELADRPSLDARTRAAVEQMRDAASRGADLVRQLLAFSKKQRSSPETLDLHRTVRGMQRLLERLLGDRLALQVELPPEPLFVHMDPTQVEQVIINLVTNARDATAATGVVRIETERIELDVRWGRLGPGPYAVLGVTDSGSGMDAETLRHIYEPFFTTKAPGKGTGLGLSTVYGIVEQSGGHIDVASQPGQGTCFRIYLPLAAPPERAEPGAVARTASGVRKAAKPAHILLVEDEPAVRAVTRRILEHAGHVVFAAASGEHALAIARELERDIDLLVTDMVMPGLGGRELAARLRVEQPDLEALLISGYNQEQLVEDVEAENLAFLAKPFSHETLLGRVTELLSAERRERRAAPRG